MTNNLQFTLNIILQLRLYYKRQSDQVSCVLAFMLLQKCKLHHEVWKVDKEEAELRQLKSDRYGKTRLLKYILTKQDLIFCQDTSFQFLLSCLTLGFLKRLSHNKIRTLSLLI